MLSAKDDQDDERQKGRELDAKKRESHRHECVGLYMRHVDVDCPTWQRGTACTADRQLDLKHRWHRVLIRWLENRRFSIQVACAA
jgi:hypothetical protein